MRWHRISLSYLKQITILSRFEQTSADYEMSFKSTNLLHAAVSFVQN